MIDELMGKFSVYVGLGGNIGDSASIVEYAAGRVASCLDFFDFRRSHLYETSPVSSYPQSDYTNAACCFRTAHSPREVLMELQRIEAEIGKIPKLKMAPRIIDLDILIFGDLWVDDADLAIPHPRWLERLFVLIPLADLADSVIIPDAEGNLSFIDIHQQIKKLWNQHGQNGVRIKRYRYAESSS